MKGSDDKKKKSRLGKTNDEIREIKWSKSEGC